MKLYYSPGACSLASHIVAEEEGITLDLVKVDLKAHTTEKGEDFFKINPKGYVPTLRLDDGSILTENVAILTYLGSRKATSLLVPPATTMDFTRLLEWLSYLTAELHKAFGPLFHGGDPEAAEKARQKIAMRLSFIEGALSGHEYLMRLFSVADPYLYVMLRWCARVKVDLALFPNLGAYQKRMAERPGVKAALAAEGLS